MHPSAPPPPSATPASPAPVDHARRFGGVVRLYGAAGAARIFAAHVMVVGIGGVGSWTAEALARSGVGQLTLVDMDHVAESNINRQIHASDATLGAAKADAMRARIASYHPHCVVHVVDDFVTPDNWANMQPAACQAIVDACDQRSAKAAMAAWLLAQPAAQRPLFITSGAAGGRRLGHLVEVADLNHVSHDALLARLRQQLRRHHGAARAPQRSGITCVFSREPAQASPDAICPISTPGADSAPDTAPTTTPAGAGLNCHGYGSAVSVTAMFGLAAAGWILDALARRSSS